MSEDTLLRYAKLSVAPERRVQAFIAHDPRLQWTADLVDSRQGDVILSGGTLRDILLGHIPAHPSVTVDGITPRKLRSYLDQHGNVTLEGGEHAISFSPATAPSNTVFIATHPHDRDDFTMDSLRYSQYWGMLTDPYSGLDDIHARTIRTVGYPLRAFANDPLRALRALRLAAERKLTFAPETWHALTHSLPRLNRIARNADGEPQYMHARQHLGAALLEIITAEPRYGAALVHASGLGSLLLPELFADADHSESAWQKGVRALDILSHADTAKSHRLSRLAPVAVLAILLAFHKDALRLGSELMHKWHLDQFPEGHKAHAKKHDLMWLLQHLGHFHETDPASMTPSAFEKMFTGERGRHLLALMQAAFLSEGKHHVARERLHVARRLLDAFDEKRAALPKLVRGRDLTALGILPGPLYRTLLAKVRDAQLAGHVATKDDALAYLRHQIATMR